MEIDITLTTNDTNNNNNKQDINSFTWTISNILFSLFLFIIACLCEIGGGYLIWIGCRDNIKKPILSIILGCIILIIYGFIPTLQPTSSFGRLYAVYGGFFIIGSYLWGMYFDDMKIDKGDIIGGFMAVIGVCVAFFWSR
jgi:drug/metabolite transporter superfamily protein YnfA